MGVHTFNNSMNLVRMSGADLGRSSTHVQYSRIIISRETAVLKIAQ